MPRLLDKIERWGNALPHPATLFALATGLLFLVSDLAQRFAWQIEKAALSADAETTVVSARSLLEGDGLWWAVSELVPNFINFPPLGIVIVGMLGIGVAERSGFIPALLETAVRHLRAAWLTPTVVFVGIMSSLGLDAGYVVLPPIAAALYVAQGRSPLAGVAAAFAGISAGFSANLSITAIDPLLAGFSEAGARFLAPDYEVAETGNWWFMIASTFALTAVGWAVTAWWVEPRVPRQPAAAAAAANAGAMAGHDMRALKLALASIAVCALITAFAILHPTGPLHGIGGRHPRWVEATVPLIFIFFLLPGTVYGFASGRFSNDKDLAHAMGETMASLGPYIVLAFFAAQFIAGFKYSGLGEMLAITGGDFLVALALPHTVLVLAFVAVVMLGNLLVGIGVGEVRLLCAGVRAHVHAGRRESGIDPGRLSCGRLNYQCDHAAEPVHDHHRRARSTLYSASRSRHGRRDDVAVRCSLRRVLVLPAGRLDAVWAAARSGRTAGFPALAPAHG